jgi:hypothetical protein
MKKVITLIMTFIMISVLLPSISQAEEQKKSTQTGVHGRQHLYRVLKQ